MKTNMLFKLYLITFFIGLCSLANSQSTGWQWANSYGENSFEYGFAITTDKNGNTISTGYFAGPSITFGGTTLLNPGSSGGARSFYVVKHDPSGNVIWAANANGNAENNGKGISTDTAGNIYVVGEFNSATLTFGTITINNAGGNDVFIVKYDPNGTPLWAHSAGGSLWDNGKAISTDKNGYSVITGGFSSTSITFGSTTLVNGGQHSVFTVRYDPNGNVLWAKGSAGTAYDSGYGIGMDSQKNVYITGGFSSPTTAFGSETLSSSGGADIFIVKYDSLGNEQWSDKIGGAGYEEGYAVTTDANDNIIVAGGFASSSITAGTVSLISNGTWDILTVKYDQAGNVVWAKNAGGTAEDIAHAVTVDASNNVFLTGYYRSTSITLGPTQLMNAGGDDIFILEYDEAGNLLMLEGAGGTSYDYASSITVDNAGSPVITGVFSSSSIIFGSTTLTINGPGELYIAKLGISPSFTEDINNSLSSLIYPNPFTNTFTVELENDNWSLMEIYSSHGQLIKNMKLNMIKTEVNLSELANGLYFVKLTNPQGKTLVNRIVKN